MKRILIAVLLCSAAACTKKNVRVDVSPIAPPTVKVASTADTTEKAAPADNDALADARSDESNRAPVHVPLVAPVVQFEFDSYVIDAPSRDLLAAFVERVLAEAKPPPLTITGHADERGTAEYNLQLGQRRADVVAKYLVDAGFSKNLVRAVSYGEERPAVTGEGEQVWSRNRRAEVQLPSGVAAR